MKGSSKTRRTVSRMMRVTFKTQVKMREKKGMKSDHKKEKQGARQIHCM